MPRGDAHPPRLSRICRPGSRRSRSARGCRAPGSGARAVGADAPARGHGGRAGARASTTTAARGSGSRRCRTGTRGLSRSLTMIGTFPQLEYPRAWPAWTRVVGPMLWEPGGPLVEPPAGDGPVVLVATVDVAGPLALAAAGVPGRAGGRAGARDRDLRGASRRPRTRCSCRGCPTRETMPRCDLVVMPRRARDARAGAGERRAGAWSARRAATWPRTPRAWTGRASGVRLAPRFCTPWGVRLAVRRALRSPCVAGAGGGIGARGRSRHPGPPRPRPSWSAGPRPSSVSASRRAAGPAGVGTGPRRCR